MKLKNYTGKIIKIPGIQDINPHGNIIVMDDSGYQPREYIAPSGERFFIQVRVRNNYKVAGLPQPEEGVVFIVASNVLRLVGSQRQDLVAPCEVEFSKDMKSIHCYSFKSKERGAQYEEI